MPKKLVLVDTPIRRRSKRDAIKAKVVRWIEEQKLLPGERVKSQNELAAHFKVTAVTVHKALRELAADGIVYRRSGSGTFVGPDPDDVSVKKVCWVLPGEHLESPDYNPIWWPYIQQWYRAFLTCAGKQFTFTTRSVEPDAPVPEVAAELGAYDVVFFHHTKEPRQLLDYLVESRIVPVVAFGKAVDDISCLTVDHDIGGGVDAAVDYLVGLGHRRIGLVVTKETWGEPWVKGYRSAMRRRGLSSAGLMVQVGIPREAGFDAAKWLVERDFPCTAMLCDSDLHGVGLVDGLRKRGVEVPEKISVVGYDGLDYAVRHPPFLTSLQVPYEEMIRKSLEIVFQRLGRPSPVRHLNLAGEILPGATCMSCPSTDE